jgi:hypothetical protein
VWRFGDGATTTGSIPTHTSTPRTATTPPS